MFKIGIKYNQIGLLEIYLLQSWRMAPKKDWKPKILVAVKIERWDEKGKINNAKEILKNRKY